MTGTALFRSAWGIRIWREATGTDRDAASVGLTPGDVIKQVVDSLNSSKQYDKRHGVGPQQIKKSDVGNIPINTGRHPPGPMPLKNVATVEEYRSPYWGGR